MGSIGAKETTTKATATAVNSDGFKDGDTSDALIDNAFYKVIRWSTNTSRDYGVMTGADAKLMLKGYQYQQLGIGDGMWFHKSGNSRFGYDVRRVER